MIRLRDVFSGVEFTTHGVLQDLEGARNMAAREEDGTRQGTLDM